MHIIVLFIVAFLFIISGILIRNRLTFEPLAAEIIKTSGISSKAHPCISICIPARNEELTIEKCVHSLANQDYPNYEVLILNDCSTDHTDEILKKLKKQYPSKIKIIDGSPKPGNWLGKPWACHQLSEKAAGSYLIFADADTWFEPQVLNHTIQRFRQYDLDFITVWPQQIIKSFWEQVLIPMLYYALLGFLITDYVTKLPKWIPKYFHSFVAPYFVAANGQFMAFKREAYEKTGGHTSVKNEVVEDMALSKIARINGLKMRMFHGISQVFCRMYRNHHDIFEGFRKNFLHGFNKNVFLFSISALFHMLVYLFPVYTLLNGLWNSDASLILLSILALSLPVAQRILLSFWFRWKPVYALTHFLGVLWFERLGIRVLFDYISGREIRWKDRKL